MRAVGYEESGTGTGRAAVASEPRRHRTSARLAAQAAEGIDGFAVDVIGIKGIYRM